MFKILNNVGWVLSIVAIIGALIMYVYEKINRKD
jgi:YbbR domain-containing protein